MNLTNDDKVQQKLTRVRPPRVKITYDVETGGSIQQVEIPFIVGIFANLSGDTTTGAVVLPSASSQTTSVLGSGSARPLADYKERDMVDIDRDSFNTVMSNASVSISLSDVPNTIDTLRTAPGGTPVASADPVGTTLPFTTFDDFLPGNIVANIPTLKGYSDARANLRDLQSRAESDLDLNRLLNAITAFSNAASLAKSVADQLPVSTAGAALSIAAHWGDTAQKVSSSTTVSGAVTASGDYRVLVTGTCIVSGMGDVTVSGTVNATVSGTANGTLTGVVTGSATINGSGTITVAGLIGGSITASGTAAVSESFSASVQLAGTLDVYLSPTTVPDIASLTALGSGAASSIAARALGQIVGEPPTDPAKQPGYAQDLAAARTLLGYFSQQVLLLQPNSATDSLHATQLIDRRVAAIDKALSTQVSDILHHPNFQQLEATWRGLQGLVANTETGRLLKLRVFNARQQELIDDLDQAVEFDQSKLFKMIYEAEYGTYGGFPYSLLVADYEFGSGDPDIDLLSKLTQVAAAAHAPLISAASPQLFGLSDFSKLANPRDLSQIFEGIRWSNWNAFRDTEDSRYLTLVLPHTLLRQPYDYRVADVKGFKFVEDITDGTPGTIALDATINNPGDPQLSIRPTNKKFLWGNASYALAGRITNAFALYHWTAAIRGEEGGGLVDGLPLYIYPSELGAPVALCPTEVSITDRREKELNDLGFVALCHCKNTAHAVFFGGQTVNLPKRYLSDAATANAETSAMLPYMLAASRFAHYIKVMMRKKVGSFLTRANIESYINTWIAQYVLLDDNASQDIKASYPLRAAEVMVTPVPGEIGSYNATLFIKPHFQLEDLRVSIRLVADLPKT